MKWTVKNVKIKDLKLVENNPRTITKKEVERLKKSLNDQGNFKPLIVNQDMTVLGGNQRLRALEQLGYETVDVSIPDKQLTEEEAKKIILLDNDHNGEFDFDKPTKSSDHPTMKPVGLLAYQVKNSSSSKNIVLDLFGGSGSTLIACEQTNRKCYMMELDEHYCSVIIERWQQLTNQKAKKLT